MVTTNNNADSGQTGQAIAPVPTSATLLLTPLRAGVPAEGGAMEVLVRVQAPQRPPQADGAAHKRMPLRLALVVDRSGSMSGEPLDEALRCVQHIGSLLQPEDQLAVVLYDDHVQVPMPLARAPGAQAVQQALDGVDSGGSTDLHAGWETGARELVAGSAGAISRVVLLSDGQANHGLTDTVAIASECTQWLQRGVSTTTVGLGRGFNEELMVAMAQAGGGQQYYGQRAEDLYDAFDEELSLLQAMMLRQLRVKPVLAPEVLAEPLGLATADAAGWMSLPDLAWGAEAWILLRLHVAAEAGGITPRAAEQGADQPVQRTLLGLSLQAQDMDGATVAMHVAPLMLPVLPAAKVARLPADETVARRLQEVGFADMTMQVRQLLQQGKTGEARALLRRAEEQVANYPWLAGKLQRLQALLERDAMMASKEMLFSSRKMGRRLNASVESYAVADETESTEIPAYLRRKGEEGTGRKRT